MTFTKMKMNCFGTQLLNLETLMLLRGELLTHTLGVQLSHKISI